MAARIRFMSNSDEGKVGACHDSGSSFNPRGGGSGSSDFVVPGAEVRSPSCTSASPDLHFLRSASSCPESRVPEEGREEGPLLRASLCPGGRGCGQSFG